MSAIKEIFSNSENVKNLLQVLLHEKYMSEFEIIDGLSQHPDGMNFEEWIIDILEKC